ncbi:uncharacterized protein MELLADRAFT_93486 [Melampsora larici-populina 98AG31]|uniref:ferric-chelate reductase (NADPH) n=1 Tax=Melampsora larici-populina (strain 98AG31 / pathotype 3-4-7) TaxID=747676 RepID=F4RAK1_MELLP|nr:uncharacterized protein MELLADRAFT_93486 [Melampsora larici-populina 98AG31]EGG10769.1 hypothetical protein MELLADRAFT_93486 [Melampsora larici-populina 98AG31]
MSGQYGGSDDPCILGYTNGVYPNGTLGKGNWQRFKYMPTEHEKAICQAPNDPWIDSPRYAWWTMYFILAALVAIAVVNAIKRLHALNRPDKFLLISIVGLPSVISFRPKISAYARLISYPQSNWLGGIIPATGPSILLFLFLLFTNLICFIPRPYYRPPNYGSSVLGLRTEWVATAMMPWIYVLSCRRNVISYLTGVSYQRVMTIHKYSPWICLYYSIIHTWTNIIRANRQQPWWYTWQNNALYRNGFPPLVALAWLCIMSLAPIRARFYETFYFFHMVAALIFLIWMYWHTEAYLNSFQYLHATAGLWGVGIAWRILSILANQGFILKGFPRAELETLPGDVYSMKISVPPAYRWKAGSHVSIRFLTVRPWETHPFTIASIPNSRQYSYPNRGKGSEKEVLSNSVSVTETQVDSQNEEQSVLKNNEMYFLVQPHSGLTRKLNQLLSKRQGKSNLKLPCILDGPYSGFIDSIKSCDNLIMISGGTGISALIPLILEVNQQDQKIQIEVHWATRNNEVIETWFSNQDWIEKVKLNVYLTTTLTEISSTREKEKVIQSESESQLKEPSRVDQLEEGILPVVQQSVLSNEDLTSNEKSKRYSVKRERPKLESIIENATNQYHGRVGVVVCGPKIMNLTVRNAVAKSQLNIIKDKTLCKELELYEEMYSM